MAVPYTFGTATSSIPLSQLDSNFSTAITLGNTAIQLGNTATTLNNMTLANVTIASGNVTLTNVTVTTANVTTANITTAVIVTGTVTNLTATSANVTTLGVTGVSTLTGGAVVQGLTVGLGAGAVSTNTVVGVSALATNISGTSATAVGYQSGNLATGTGNQLFGYSSGSAITTGAKNVIIGSYTGSAAPISATGNNYIVLSDGDGNVRQTINSSGNVGIGVTSPAGRLDVGATTDGQLMIQIRNLSAGTSAYSALFLGNDTNATAAYIGLNSSTNTTRAGGTSSMNIINGLNSPMTFGISGTERMRLDTSGNLGIGTSSPSASAILDAQSTTKGVRMPNMTTTQKNAISSPAAGLMVFDTTLSKLCVYSGAAWQTITSV